MEPGESLDLRCEDCDLDYRITYTSRKGPSLAPDVCPFCGDDIDTDPPDDEDE